MKHVIFDLDGTLIDSAVVCCDILNQMLRDRRSSRVISVEQAKPYLSLGGVHMVSGLLAEECGDPDLEIAEFRSRYRNWPTPANSPFDGVIDGLGRLIDFGFTLSICSNKPQHLCEKVLSDLGISNLFQVVCGSVPGEPLKPHPFLLAKTLTALGAQPHEALFVGDSDLDHGVAEAVGMPFVLVTYGYADAAWNSTSCVRVDHFADVVGLARAMVVVEEPLQRVA